MELLKNIKSIIEDDFDLASITVLGVKLGDKLSAIDNNIIEGERKNNGRWIYTSRDVQYRVNDNDEIVEFLIEGNILKELGIESQAAIIDVFGKTKEINKKNGWYDFIYEQKNTVITWLASSSSSTFDEIRKIYLGDNIIKPQTYNALSFYGMYQRFKDIGKSYDWNEVEILKEGNKIQRYQYKALKALLSALGISSSLKSFDDKTFIQERTIKDYNIVFDKMSQFEETYFSSGNGSFPKMRIGYIEIVFTYDKLTHFLKKLTALQLVNSGFLEAGFFSAQYYLALTGKVLSSIDQDAIQEIYDLLSLIICPKQLVFTKGELIEKYNFPDDDYEYLLNEEERESWGF